MTTQSNTHPPITRAVIPAAGLGTRLRPLTPYYAKEMLPVGRKPVLAHIADELRGAGITEAVFVVSANKPQIREYFGEEYVGEGATEKLPPLRCFYVQQAQQRGSGDALLCAQERVAGHPFVVVFGDCMVDGPDPSLPLRRLIATHREHQAAATLLVEQVAWEKVSRYGVMHPETPQPATPTEPFACQDLIEKPRPEDAPSNLVLAARLALQPEVFDFLHRGELDIRGELNLPDAVRAMRQAGGPLWAVPLQPGEARRDIGNMESFMAAFVRYALRDPEYGPAIRHVVQTELTEPRR